MTRGSTLGFLTRAAAVPLVVVALAGCGGHAYGSGPTTASRRSATVGVANDGSLARSSSTRRAGRSTCSRATRSLATPTARA